MDDLFKKLEEVKKLAADVDVSILGGDLYHWPRPRDISHALVRRTIEFLRDWPSTLFVVAGNHDLVPEQMAGLTRTPLGVVLEAHHGYPAVLLDDRLLGFDSEVRWEADATRMPADLPEHLKPLDQYLVVHLSAAHWSYDLDERADLYRLQRSPLAQFAVKVVHGMCMPPGEYPFPCVTIDQIETEADVVLLGHMHWTTPPMRYNGTLFVGPGAIARTARSDDEARRQVQVAILTLEPGREPEVEFVPLKSMRPADEVFAWAERGFPTVGMFEGYVAVLEAGLEVEGLSVEDTLAAMETRAPKGVVERAREYLKEAGL